MDADPDDQQFPSDGTDPVVLSVAVPSRKVRLPARLWVHVLGVLLMAAGPALFVVGLFQGDRSMDTPIDGAVRYGLLGNGGIRVWRCSEGHDHVSAPFWLAALVMLAAAFAIWWLLARRFTRTPRATARR